MNLYQLVKLALRGIIDNKLRSFLTMLGIIIGVASVIALVSFASGATSQVTSQIEGMGSNILSVNIMGRGAQTTLTYEEALDLKNPYISGIAPTVNSGMTVKFMNKTYDTGIIGTNSDYFTINNRELEAGRIITETDLEDRAKVAVIGPDVAKELGMLNPVGETIKIGGNNFTVVGLLQSKGSSMMGSQDDMVIVPITTAQRLFQTGGVRSITMQAVSPDDVEAAKAYLEADLKRLFKDDEDAYNVFDQTELLNTVKQSTSVLSMMLGGIAGISLLVGGIGIMNIMLVTVTERTREIGIRKAIGAKKRDILTQFLIESSVLSGVGGMIGVIVGFILAKILSTVANIPTQTTLLTVGVSFGFALLVGIIFGIYPANRAANLNPIDALHYE
ncbi:ABC transporter permease [Calorimonas adulescens]|uniref:FtsX-like permease family protein n=1 Tax=Calorimonas adulescens TaxID=2606906 RepID=A0A5D8QEA2_9THEO|nr:ABC transporter permease [Calorimonas adulescens]TZE82885.1 FtsX-like permease family protein [Calorimonas adulescens]